MVGTHTLAQWKTSRAHETLNGAAAALFCLAVSDRLSHLNTSWSELTRTVVCPLFVTFCLALSPGALKQKPFSQPILDDLKNGGFRGLNSWEDFLPLVPIHVNTKPLK